MNGPNIDPNELAQLKKRMAGMSKKDLHAMLTNIMKNNNFGLGTKDDLSSVSGNHQTDATSRLRQAIARKASNRKTKVVRNRNLEKQQTANKELHRVDGKDGEASPNNDHEIENLDTPHVHTDACNHDTPHVHTAACNHDTKVKFMQNNDNVNNEDATNNDNTQVLGKNAKRNKRRREAAKTKQEVVNEK